MPPLAALQTCLWLDHALLLTGLDAGEFGQRFVERGKDRFQDSKAVFKWRAFKRRPSADRVAQIETLVPGTAWVYRLPLFALLTPQPLTVKRVEAITTPCRAGAALGDDWHFACTKQPFTHVRARWETSGLAERGDVWGLIGCVGSARFAEATHDATLLANACRDMYRVLPGVVRTPWASRALPLLRQCLDVIRQRASTSTCNFLVNWRLIELYQQSNFYAAARHSRPRDPEGGRFLEYPDVIKEIDGARQAGLDMAVRSALERKLYEETAAQLSKTGLLSKDAGTQV